MVETFVQSTDDVVKFLKDQHNLIKDMFEEVFSASSDDARRHRHSPNCVNSWRCTRPLKRWWSTRGSATRSRAATIIVDARLVEEHDSKEQFCRRSKAMDIVFQGVSSMNCRCSAAR